MLSRHAMDRINDDKRFTAQERNEIMHRADAVSEKLNRGEWAVRIATLKERRNPAWGDISNGDIIVAIVRDGCCTTVFLRRGTQPWTPAALRVQRVYPAA